MARKPIPCPRCQKLYGGQGKICLSCYKSRGTAKRIKSETCPKCGKCKHRSSEVCRECYRKSDKRVTKECPACKKEFTRYKSLKAKYCSKKCARSGSPTRPRKRTKIICDFCEKEFERHLSEIARSKTPGNYCSSECWYAHNQGENHYGYNGSTPERQACYSSREWKQAVKVVWKRDKASCQRCGIKAQYYDGKFNIHHIVSFQVKDLRTDPKNLILFCSKCHKWVHSNENNKKEWIKYVDPKKG